MNCKSSHVIFDKVMNVIGRHTRLEGHPPSGLFVEFSDWIKKYYASTPSLWEGRAVTAGDMLGEGRVYFPINLA